MIAISDGRSAESRAFSIRRRDLTVTSPAKYKHQFDPDTAELRIRTDRQGAISLAVVGLNATSRLRIWIRAGANAWSPPNAKFVGQRLPYLSEKQAITHAGKIYPTRGDFDRWLAERFSGWTVTDAEEMLFGKPFVPAEWTAT